MSKHLRTIIVLSVLVSFIVSSVQVPAFAQIDPMPFMPKPGTMVSLSPEYTPAYLKGIVIHPENALKFDFIIYKGDKPLSDTQKREEYTKLTKYFLASLAIPDDDQWVNLSPYEKDRIIKDDFGKTEMGRDLLAQDYMLKQITASLIYPQDSLGKKFWDKVYTQAQKQYGTTNIPVNTFNKVWILPDDALIYEKGNTAYVLKNHLRVMLEEDYLSLQKHSGIESVIARSPQGDEAISKRTTHTIASQIIKQIILPELQREVNEDKNFAPLRQVYSGMLLATWFKRTLKQSLLGQIYANKAKVKGVDQDPKTNEQIYRQYLQAYKKGVFNFIKEDTDKLTNETMPRKYFSGGTGTYSQAMLAFDEDVVHRTGKLTGDEDLAMKTEIDKDDDDVAVAMNEDAAVRGKEDGAMTIDEAYEELRVDLPTYLLDPDGLEKLIKDYWRQGTDALRQQVNSALRKTSPFNLNKLMKRVEEIRQKITGKSAAPKPEYFLAGFETILNDQVNTFAFFSEHNPQPMATGIIKTRFPNQKPYPSGGSIFVDENGTPKLVDEDNIFEVKDKQGNSLWRRGVEIPHFRPHLLMLGQIYAFKWAQDKSYESEWETFQALQYDQSLRDYFLLTERHGILRRIYLSTLESIANGHTIPWSKKTVWTMEHFPGVEFDHGNLFDIKYEVGGHVDSFAGQIAWVYFNSITNKISIEMRNPKGTRDIEVDTVTEIQKNGQREWFGNVANPAMGAIREKIKEKLRYWEKARRDREEYEKGPQTYNGPELLKELREELGNNPLNEEKISSIVLKILDGPDDIWRKPEGGGKSEAEEALRELLKDIKDHPEKWDSGGRTFLTEHVLFEFFSARVRPRLDEFHRWIWDISEKFGVWMLFGLIHDFYHFYRNAPLTDGAYNMSHYSSDNLYSYEQRRTAWEAVGKDKLKELLEVNRAAYIPFVAKKAVSIQSQRAGIPAFFDSDSFPIGPPPYRQQAESFIDKPARLLWLYFRSLLKGAVTDYEQADDAATRKTEKLFDAQKEKRVTILKILTLKSSDILRITFNNGKKPLYVIVADGRPHSITKFDSRGYRYLSAFNGVDRFALTRLGNLFFRYKSASIKFDGIHSITKLTLKPDAVAYMEKVLNDAAMRGESAVIKTKGDKLRRKLTKAQEDREKAMRDGHYAAARRIERKILSLQRDQGNKAMRSPGGIDLNAANLNLRIKRDGNGVPLPLAQQDLAQLNDIEGLDPVILSIKPASQTALFSQLVGP